MTSNGVDIKTILTRRVEEIIDKKHLEQALRTEKKLRVKLGIDPTGQDLHIGHAVPLMKLREFQGRGHTAVLIIGDWTAQIGDPSEKSETRPPLTFRQTRENARTYLAQAFKILDKERTEVHYNSQWFKDFDFESMIGLLSKASVARLMSHETFRERLKKDQPFFAHELLYPLMQAYDSVTVRADVELGAMDQKFNLIMGRKLQRLYGQEPQDLVLVKYLTGLDGRLMGKTYHNYVALTDSPEEMFGKIMSLPDNLVLHYFELATEVSEKEIQQIKKVHPKRQKTRLAGEIVSIYHGKNKALAAEKEFEKKFGRARGEIKADYTLKKKPGKYLVVDLLVEGKLAQSKSEARRKIREGAVEIDGSRIKDFQARIKVVKNTLIRLGKRFLRII